MDLRRRFLTFGKKTPGPADSTPDGKRKLRISLLKPNGHVHGDYEFEMNPKDLQITSSIQSSSKLGGTVGAFQIKMPGIPAGAFILMIKSNLKGAAGMAEVQGLMGQMQDRLDKIKSGKEPGFDLQLVQQDGQGNSGIYLEYKNHRDGENLSYMVGVAQGISPYFKPVNQGAKPTSVPAH